MNTLEAYLSTSTHLWHGSNELIYLFGETQLNELIVEEKVEVREGLNCNVVRYLNI